MTKKYKEFFTNWNIPLPHFYAISTKRVRLENNFWLVLIFIVAAERRKINKHFLAL